MGINPSKTRLNFTAQPLPKKQYTAADGTAFVPWCGLLINSANLEIQADYTRYAGQDLRDSLTLPLAKVGAVRPTWGEGACSLVLSPSLCVRFPVCLCVSASVCYKRTCTHARAHTHTHTRTHAHRHTHTHTHIHIIYTEREKGGKRGRGRGREGDRERESDETSDKRHSMFRWKGGRRLSLTSPCPDILYVVCGQAPGSQVGVKLCAHLRPKCHPVLLDASINSPTTVRLNLYQVGFPTASMHVQGLNLIPWETVHCVRLHWESAAIGNIAQRISRVICCVRGIVL
jgi:hypothetical protein